MSDKVNKPRLITRRSVMADVAARWKEQYSRPDGWTVTHTGPSEAVYAKLRALNPGTASRDDFANIIGNNSWTSIICTACGRDVDEAVEVGEPPDYESHTATLCRPCLQEAIALLPPDA